MSALRRFLTSSVGRKFVMAFSGLVLVLFLLGHLAGNLQIFLGPESLNRYAHFLQSNKELLWPVRIVLLLCFIVHIWTAITLTIENQKARPVGYEGHPIPPGSTLASRTMILTGFVVLFFVIFHLLHFTIRVPQVNLTGIDFRTLQEQLPWGETRSDVYRMMIYGFRQPVIVALYILLLAALALHLSHSLKAMWQSLGIANRFWKERLDRLASWLSWLVFIGYSFIPVSVWLGLIGSV